MEILQQAHTYRKAKEYEKALPIYQSLWEVSAENKDPWIGWGLAFCLQKLKFYTEGLEIARVVYQTAPDFPPIRNVYAWCIYFSEMQGEKEREEARFLKAARGILQLSSAEDSFSPYTKAIFRVLQYYAEKRPYAAKEILDWLGKLNIDLLEEKAFYFEDSSGKKRALAPEKEQYFMYKTKALLELDAFEDCVCCCKEALAKLSTFHYDNDVWFNWRIALCARAMGESEKALQILNSLLSRKKEWFIQKEIAEIYYTQKQEDKALECSLAACLSFGQVDKKVALFRFMLPLLENKKAYSCLKMQVALLYQMRKEAAYPIDTELQNWVEKYAVEAEKMTVKSWEKALTTEWKLLSSSYEIWEEGIIHSLLANGRAGFIQSANRKTNYYFSLQELVEKKLAVAVGQRVRFRLVAGFDKKKNCSTLNAVFISRL